VEAAARVQAPGPTYFRRQPEKTALYRVMQEHLLTFEQEWTDAASGRTLPKFVTGELHGFMLHIPDDLGSDSGALGHRIGAERRGHFGYGAKRRGEGRLGLG
jgi:hypothetical protein